MLCVFPRVSHALQFCVCQKCSLILSNHTSRVQELVTSLLPPTEAFMFHGFQTTTIHVGFSVFLCIFDSSYDFIISSHMPIHAYSFNRSRLCADLIASYHCIVDSNPYHHSPYTLCGMTRNSCSRMITETFSLVPTK